jgi:secreted PhoX family phosphatase
MDFCQSEGTGNLLLPDQQQEPWRQAECRWRRHIRQRPEPAREEQLRPDRALAPGWRRPHGSGFTWDLYVLAGNPTVHSDAYAGSANINEENMFNSPDGLAFDSNGLVWIQTDGNYKNEGDFAGQGNNQMLAGDPVTGEIRRFMVGPNECEITGLTWSPDRRTMFVGIQHPGERATATGQLAAHLFRGPRSSQ